MPDQSHPTGAVFISYGSQDATAAMRICEALRAAGVEVWFDQSELRGGDSWDAQIKKHIHDCAVFIPVISARTNARSEGYFRREWKLATRRLQDMADDVAFLVPVVIDGTREVDARVPEEFLRAQWTWLPNGETPPTFAERVRQLLGGESTPVRNAHTALSEAIESTTRRRFSARPWFSLFGGGRHRARNVGVAFGAVLLVLGGVVFWYYQGSKKAPAVAAAPLAKFSPPAHSIAVLAFTNMSGDPKDEYFSDGLSEEMLNMLARIDRLQVASRTSSFSFKGTSIDIPAVGRKLNVGAVLEGSVRKTGDRVRITAQLTSTVTGFTMWSQTFDRVLEDTLVLQTEIATKVASELQVDLFAGEMKQLTVGGTTNPTAFDVYLRARRQDKDVEETSLRAAIALYEQAIKLDPTFALAHASRADALLTLADVFEPGASELKAKARASAEKAVALAPKSGWAHDVLARVLQSFGRPDLARIESVYKRGLAVEPGNYYLLSDYANFAANLQRPDAIATARKAVTLNPLDPFTHYALSVVLQSFRQFDEARGAFDMALKLRDTSAIARAERGVLEIMSGRPAAALTYCEPAKAEWMGQICLAIAYYQIGRKPEATAVLNGFIAENGDAMAYQYAEIYAQHGQKESAMKWLETALRLQDPGLLSIKADALLDPIRDEPRFKQIVEQLNFPK